MENNKIIDITGVELTPGKPTQYKGNGKTKNKNGKLIECCCDECDYFLLCYPEWSGTSE